MDRIKFQHKIHTKAAIKKRLLSYLELSTETERNYLWYKDAHNFASLLATKHGLQVFQVAGVIAALSPQKSWPENKKITQAFLRGVRNSHTAAQLYKAELCLQAENENEIFGILTKTGLKTSYFYNNILYPTIDSGVTIDRHAIGACLNSFKNIQRPMAGTKLTKPQYDFFAQAYTEVAVSKNILPLHLQSTIWQTYRRLKDVHEQYDREYIPF